jgi:hypothetical protein
MTLFAAQVFRDYETDGVPGSGPHQPIKSEIRAWGSALESGLSGIRLAKTASYTVQAADVGQTIALSGNALYSLIFANPTGYAAPWSARVINEDAGRGKRIVGVYTTSATSLTIATGAKAFIVPAGLDFTGFSRWRAHSLGTPTSFMSGTVGSYASATLTLNVDTIGGSGTFSDWQIAFEFILWPKQSVLLENQNNIWNVAPRFQRWAPLRNVTFFVDTAGSDSNDGLVSGSGALRNIQTGVNMTQLFVDWGGTNAGLAGTVSPTAGQTFAETVAVSGAQIGSNEIFIQGNGGAFNWANVGQNSMLSVGDGGICIIQDINFLSTANTFGKASIYLHNNAIIDINSGITVQGGGSNDIAVFVDNHGCICTFAAGMVVTNTLSAVVWCDNGGKVSISGVLSPTGSTQVSQLLVAKYRSVIILGTAAAGAGWGSIGPSLAVKGGLIDTSGTSVPGGTSSSTGGLII